MLIKVIATFFYFYIEEEDISILLLSLDTVSPFVFQTEICLGFYEISDLKPSGNFFMFVFDEKKKESFF